jgi:hypothetical protein
MSSRQFVEPPDFTGLRPGVIAEDDLLRSRVVSGIVNERFRRPSRRATSTPPPRLIQFWDTETIPSDVQGCLDTWRGIEAYGIKRIIFDDRRARDYIARHYSAIYSNAFALSAKIQ